MTTSENSSPEKAKIPKKRKDKRRAKSESRAVTTPEQNVEAFIGVPLVILTNIWNEITNRHFFKQIQNNSSQNYNPETPPETSCSQHNLLVTPDISSPLPKFTWETPWNNVVSASCEKFVWSHSPTTCHSANFNMKPMVASAPVTPNIIPYPGKTLS